MPRLGIVLHHGIDTGPELTEYGQIAEEAGFESIWVTERYFHEETYSVLGYLAAVTRNIKLGLGVTNPYTRHPALLAMASATLDRICGGRFLLGLGRSEKRVIQDKMGIPYVRPQSTLEQTVTVLRELLSGRRVDFLHSPLVLNNVKLAIEPVQKPLPIYLAAIGPKALRLAGAIADGVLLNAYSPIGYVRYAVEEVRNAAREAGRDPGSFDIACMLPVRLTDSPETVIPSLKQRLVRLLAEPNMGELLVEKGGWDSSILGPIRASGSDKGGDDPTGLIADNMVDAFYLVGGAKRCKERIEEYRQAGVDIPLVLPRLSDFKAVAEALGGS